MEMARGLAEEVVRTFGEVRLRVFGTSMAPAILPGDLVLVRRAGLNEIFVEDVVLFAQNGRLFVHRAVGLKGKSSGETAAESCLITRGDRLQHDDPPVSSDELLGRVVSVERGERKIVLGAPSGLFARLLRASDRATCLYVRLLAVWRSVFFRGMKCGV